LGKQCVKVNRQRAVEFETSGAGGMVEAEPPGMQGLAGKAGDEPAGRIAAGSRAAGARAIDDVTDERMAAMREMYSDLMGASSREAALDEGCLRARRPAAKGPLEAVEGDRRLATSAAEDGHFLPIRWIAADIGNDFAERRLRHAPDKGGVSPIDAMLREILSVPSGFPGAGWMTRPGGLSTTIRCASS
jgi:hypothetical protein